MAKIPLKLEKKSLNLVVEKILGKFSFLLQKEIISRIPGRFANRIVVAKEGAAWIIGSNDEIFRYYILGTKPHIIKPKTKQALAFNWPKAPVPPTSPKSGMWVYKEVKHPGTKPHNVIEDIEKDTNLLQKLLDRAVKLTLK